MPVLDDYNMEEDAALSLSPAAQQYLEKQKMLLLGVMLVCLVAMVMVSLAAFFVAIGAIFESFWFVFNALSLAAMAWLLRRIIKAAMGYSEAIGVLSSTSFIWKTRSHFWRQIGFFWVAVAFAVTTMASVKVKMFNFSSRSSGVSPAVLDNLIEINKSMETIRRLQQDSVYNESIRNLLRTSDSLRQIVIPKLNTMPSR